MAISLSTEDYEDVKRLVHIFKNNRSIAEDYFNQFQSGVDEPALDREMLYNILNSDDEGSKEDAQRFRAFVSYAATSAGTGGGFAKYVDVARQLEKREERFPKFDSTAFPNFGFTKEAGFSGTAGAQARQTYDFHNRGMSGEEVGFTRGQEVATGFLLGGTKIAQGILESGALAYDLYNDDAEASALKWMEEEFPEMYDRGELSTFLGKATEFGVQYGTGFGIANKIVNNIVRKKGKDYLKRKTLKDRALGLIVPAAISEPFVSTSRDITLGQAFGLYDSFVVDDENLSPRERALNLLMQKSAFGVETPFVGGAIAAIPKTVKVLGGGAMKIGGKVIVNPTKDWIISPAAKLATKELPVTIGNHSVNVGIPGLLRVTKGALGKTAQLTGGWINKGLEKIPGVGKMPGFKDWNLYHRKSAMNLSQWITGSLTSLRAGLTSSGISGPQANKIIAHNRAAVDTLEKHTKEALEHISRRIHDVAKKMTDDGLDGSKYLQDMLQKNLLMYVTSPMIKGKYLVTSDVLQKGTIKQAKFIRNLLTGLKKEWADIYPHKNVEKIINNAFKKDAQDYLAMTFKIRQTGSAGVGARVKSEVMDWMIKRMQNSKDFTGTPLNQLRVMAQTRIDALINHASKEGTTVAKLLEDTATFLSGGEVRGMSQFKGNILKKGETVPEMIQKLYGRTDDIRERVLDTVIELASSTANMKMYKDLHRIGMGKLFFNTADDLAKRGIKTPLVQIGKEFDARWWSQKKSDMINPAVSDDILGPLAGKFTTPAIHNAITKRALWTDRWLMSPIYKAFMVWKGAAQSTKTVYSPVTQLRNVSSAALFAVANGHFGRGASLLDSMRVASMDLWSKGGKFDIESFQKSIAEYNSQGLLGSSLVTKELQLIAKEVLTPSSAGIYGKWKTTDDLIDFLATHPAFKKLQRTNQIATQVYQLGDDLWKIFGYEFEKTRTGNALKIIGKDGIDPAKSLQEISKYHQEVLGIKFDVRGFLEKEGVKVAKITEENINNAIKDISGQIIRNVYPNYNAVPTLIQNLRRVPIGNFISFPAEMIRTSANIMRYGLKEMQSSNAAIRQQGAERLIGFGVAAVGFDHGLKKAYDYLLNDVLDTRKYNEKGEIVSGSSPEQKDDALQRRHVPSWNKLGPLPIIGYEMDKDDRPIIRYFNTAYQSPYSSVIAAPFYRAMKVFEEQTLLGKNVPGKIFDQALLKATVEGFSTLLKPFVADTIAFQNLVTAVIRDGVRPNGSKIYRPEDEFGEKVSASITAVTLDMTPGFVPQTTGAFKGVYNYFAEDEYDKFYKGKGNVPYNPKDELMALFTGIRIYESRPYDDIKNFHTYAFGKSRSSTLSAFYDDALKVGIFQKHTTPEQVLDAFIDYQIKNYMLSSDFYITLKDANTLGVSRPDLYNVIAGRSGITKNDAGLLLKNKFFPRSIPPYSYGTTFEEKARKMDVKLTDVLPLKEMSNINNIMNGLELRKYNKEQLREIIDAGGLENYLLKQERQSAVDVKPQQQVAESQTQTIPITPPQTIAATPQVATSAVPGTDQGLTPTEMALLSPEEQIIKLRQKGVA